MSSSLKWISSFFKFLALVSGLVLLLAVLQRIPFAVDKGGMQTYESIEMLRGESGFGNVLVPSYFPEGIRWPPRLVAGQKKPFIAAVIEFDGANMEKSLVIYESVSAGFEPGLSVRFSESRQSVTLDLGGREALVETGLCDDGGTCSRLSWREGGMFVRLFMRAPSMELIRIAESMSR